MKQSFVLFLASFYSKDIAIISKGNEQTLNNSERQGMMRNYIQNFNE